MFPRRLSLAMAAALLAACGRSDATAPGSTTPVASLTISAPDTLLARQEVTAAAVTYDAGGAVLSDRPVIWASSDSSILAVTSGGRVTPRRAGTVTLSASSNGVTASHVLSVRTLHFASTATGITVTCGLEASGDLWCWGMVSKGGFGNGAAGMGPAEVPIRAAVGHRFQSLSLASTHACGIELTGGVVCWGENAFGQLGDGTRVPHYSPAPVPGIAGASSIATGLAHTCAIVTGGRVFCWGSNNSGQLGDGTATDRLSPVPVQGLSGVTSLTTGSQHSCATAPGGAVCWGDDSYSQLGHDTTYDRLVPVRGGATTTFAPVYTAVSANYLHTCGLSAGNAFCWGSFDTGVSDGLWDARADSPQLQAAGHQFVKLADGLFVQCGLEVGGSAWCWIFGKSPVQFPSALPIADVAVGGDVACAVDSSGAVRCWDPRGNPGAAPVPVPGAPPLTNLVAGSDALYTCGFAAGGAVWCWANWTTGLTATLRAPAGTFVSLWNGGESPCALTPTGDAWCLSPGGYFVASATGSSLTAVTAGQYFNCGLTATGGAVCWSANSSNANANGQLGDGTRTGHTVPAPVAGGLTFTSIASGQAHTCGRTPAGDLYCWGMSYNGQIGDGHGVNSLTPVAVSGNAVFTALQARDYRTCGLSADGSVTCWPQRSVVQTAAPITRLSTGGLDGGLCGLDAAGNASCWRGGRAAIPLGGGLRFATLGSIGGDTSCGITLAGAAWCWGSNDFSKLGSPEAAGVTSTTVPLPVYGQE